MAMKFQEANFDKESHFLLSIFHRLAKHHLMKSMSIGSMQEKCSHQAVREDDDRDRAPEEHNFCGVVFQNGYEDHTEVESESGPNLLYLDALPISRCQPKQVISSFSLAVFPSFPGRRLRAQSRCACRMRNTWLGWTPKCFHYNDPDIS